ncbi:hypothetical protein [Treponema sp.]|uniref:hypothetical protein n=1 Tax=Treponema sp. TaxID=166 RepID=UPI0025DDA3DE|nr:hypothetical protein [Treponema sp.]MCR5219018.1 hypothetical protein [Treponema sp.]
MKKVFFMTAGILLALVFTACYEPSPLYGTWADNNGSKLSFMSDGTFSATVENSEGDEVDYEGSYTVVDNVLVFKYSVDSKSYSMNSEWDIRGAMLYLDWITDDTTKHLTLYHTSK